MAACNRTTGCAASEHELGCYSQAVDASAGLPVVTTEVTRDAHATTRRNAKRDAAWESLTAEGR